MPRARDASWPPSLLSALAMAFHALNTSAAVYRSRGDAAAVAFVLASSLALALLFLCVCLFEETPPADAARRRWLRAAAWLLSAALTVAFACRVARAMPLAGGVLVWAMSAATVGGGFYALVVVHHGVAAEDEAPSCTAARQRHNERHDNTLLPMGIKVMAREKNC
ncbi:hypothetical protein E2562_005943 [Oryza meyeriana var. granulata]|uniref:Uncharacterized protein n=1 Tax=Oryza meyeriana var. granulata TaxID=110450 RepID=A0A6G1DW56_9ORYZ|nr:hypothetical protein E2562_005943 [Oryza meyeriana var. granulata]